MPADRRVKYVRGARPLLRETKRVFDEFFFHDVNCETFHDVSMEVTVDCIRFRRAVLLPWWIAPVALSTHETTLICISTLLMFNGSPLRCVKAADYHLRFLRFENLSSPSPSLRTEITCERYGINEHHTCWQLARPVSLPSNLDRRKGIFVDRVALIYGLLSGLAASPAWLNEWAVNSGWTIDWIVCFGADMRVFNESW